MPQELPLLLLADDNADDRRMLKLGLERIQAPCRLETVKDGEELLAYLGQKGAHAGAPRPSLILADINLPLKSGLEALEELKASPRLKSIPVIIWTTSRNPADVLQAYLLGAASFFAKPDSFDELVEILKTLTQYWLRFAVLPPQRPD